MDPPAMDGGTRLGSDASDRIAVDPDCKSVVDEPHTLVHGKTIALTGRFASMSQEGIADLLRRMGGHVVQVPSRRTSLLVTGQEGWPLGPDGQPTLNLQRARRLQVEGYDLRILNEEELLTELGLMQQQAAIHRRYTLVQLGRILSVSRQQMRTWMRAGLIEPIEIVHRLAYFDYQQVASARMLAQLVQDGLSVKEIRSGLERLRRWSPEIEQPLMQLAALEENGALIVRMQDGKLADPTGQLLLDFEHSDSDTPLPLTATFADRSEKSADDAFEVAVYHEEAGDLQAAAAAYSDAIRCEPLDPILHFNLGNVVYMLGQLPEAVKHFESAAELDPLYVEAWNNLGSVLCELHDLDRAVHAFQQALSVVPEYADAHYNLADTLSRLGCDADARRHWHAYLRLDPSSAWANEVRERLARSEMNGRSD